MSNDWLCMFCLNISTEEVKPDYCHHCKVTYCESCNSALKPAAIMCQGCAKIYPKESSRFVDSQSTMGQSAVLNWQKRHSATGELFDIANDGESMYLVSVKGFGDQADIDILRELTGEEKKRVNG